MVDGSNVKIEVYFGEEADSTTPTNSTVLFGDWSGAYNLNYKHTNPGDYRITAVLSNAYGSFVLSQQISVVSDVYSLLPRLDKNPVVYTNKGAKATFLFSYFGDTKSGSHSSVTYWPGDSYNSSLGPFLMSMDFGRNVSMNQLSFDYKTPGSYLVAFLVQNPRGSCSYSVEFEVKVGISGLYLNFPTSVRANKAFSVETFLVQGNWAQFLWDFNGTVQAENCSGKCFSMEILSFVSVMKKIKFLAKLAKFFNEEIKIFNI